MITSRHLLLAAAVLVAASSSAFSQTIEDEVDSYIDCAQTLDAGAESSALDVLSNCLDDREPTSVADINSYGFHAETAKPDSKWHGLIELYFWVPIAMSGTANLPDGSGGSSASQRSLAQRGDSNPVSLDGVSGYLIPLRLDFRKGRWGFHLEFMVADLDLKGSLLGRLDIPFDLELSFSFIDVAVSYSPVLPTPGEQPWLVQIFAGARFVDMEQKLSIGDPISLKETENYVEPLIGAYFGYEFNAAWALVFRIDFSGFGVGSDLTYNLQLGAAWRFGAKKHWMLSFGWRAMGLDFDAGGNDAHHVDIHFNGPFLAIGWTY